MPSKYKNSQDFKKNPIIDNCDHYSNKKTKSEENNGFQIVIGVIRITIRSTMDEQRTNYHKCQEDENDTDVNFLEFNKQC